MQQTIIIFEYCLLGSVGPKHVHHETRLEVNCYTHAIKWYGLIYIARVNSYI